MALYVLSNAYRPPAKCILRVGRTRRLITEPYTFLAAVTVHNRRNRASVATLRLTTRNDANERRAAPQAGLFAVDEPIIIWADFGGWAEEVMSGQVREIRAAYPPQRRRPSHVTVICQDQSLRLDQRRRRQVWEDVGPVSDRGIAAAILAEHGLHLDPASGTGFHHQSLRQDGTDFRFLLQRAAANDYELVLRGNTLYFGPMRLDAEPQERIQVHRSAAAHCRYFAFENNADGVHGASFYQAQGELNGPSYGRVLRVGEPVGIAGVGRGYDGSYYVDAVSHHFSPAGYRQAFTLLRDGDGDGEPLDDFVFFAARPAGALYEVL